MSDIQLKDKVAIITGSSRGIGEAIAKSFAGAGAKVVLASRKIEGLEAVAAQIRASGGDAFPCACHTGNPEEIERLVESAVKHFGKVDLLVNNAATNPYFGPMINIDWGAWQKTFDVNVKGYFHASREVAKHLIARGAPGAIINIASVAGLMAMPGQMTYAMTKAAVLSMTKSMAVELGSANIRVNAIAPGLVETKFAAALTTNQEIVDMVMSRMAIKRLGQPSDIAGVALFLASDAAAFITGSTLVADAGWSVT